MSPDIQRVSEARKLIKAAAEVVAELRRMPPLPSTGAAPGAAGEAIANVTLAYRHLEDASMRLGKAIQALDGGISVYDRATTVGV